LSWQIEKESALNSPGDDAFNFRYVKGLYIVYLRELQYGICFKKAA